jgi:hypothetical protein
MNKFETASPLQPNDIDKMAEYIENKGYALEENIILPKSKTESKYIFLASIEDLTDEEYENSL